MGAGHKEKITAACDVMNGLRLSLSRRRTIELGLAVGMAFSATGSVRAAAEPPEVFFSPEVSADALIRIYEKLSGDWGYFYNFQSILHIKKSMLRCLYPSFPAVCLRRWTAISQFMSTNRALQPPLPAPFVPMKM